MKKVKYIALALVLMLGLIGGAYAYWQETLTVDGTVSTADFEVKFTDEYTMPDGGTTVTFDKILMQLQEGEDTIGAGFYNGYPEAGGAESDLIIEDEKVTITITNGWPHLFAQANFVVENNSDIPVKLEEIRLNGDFLPDGKYESDIVHINLMQHPSNEPLLPGEEIAPNGEVLLYCTVHLQDGDNVPKDGEWDFDFEFEMDWVQWNKPAE